MINVLADKYIYKLQEFLPDEVNLTLFEPQQELEIPKGTEALLIRTTVKIPPETISAFPPALKFVATASAGTDHVDTDWLQQSDISFAYAAGCNARAVAEYLATAVIIWAAEKNVKLDDLTAGIIGIGNTGGETLKLLESAGLKTVAYDPPRAERENSFQSASLDEVLNCDILTFHTPLIFAGDYPTFHWLNEEKLSNSHSLIINASRGGVVDENALLQAYKNKKVGDYILDVWENEPFFDDKIAANAFIHTPHIAGYSVQAKLKASKLVANALCDYFDLRKTALESTQSKLPIKVSESVASLSDLLNCLHPVKDYHQKFSKLIGKPNKVKGTGFNKLRTTHPLRYEYNFLSLPASFHSFNEIFK